MTAGELAALGLSPAALADLKAAVPALHRWYRAHARDLPWRRTRNPYAVWISEAMLQQTRVAAVVPYFERWMALFPTVRALAEADEIAVLRAWEGLGYYARARNLHRAAREVAARFGGRVPEQHEDFRALPGVGPYTAAAVLSLAFGRDLAVVDGNVRRVLARLTALASDPRRRPQATALEGLARELLPAGTAALHNQAVMELGATLCSPRSPGCPDCPLQGPCRAAASGSPEQYPLRTPRNAVPHYRVSLGLVFRNGRIFIDRRPSHGLLGGLWEFPGGKVEEGENPEEALHRELREEFGLRVEPEGALPQVRHAYSHFRVTLYPHLCRFLDMDPGRCAEGEREWLWVDPADLPRYPMPRANRKVLEHLARG
ncbi:MAG: A/G-specific adenine glycosylase [Thermodesulfobacteriota bacterium]